jgi:hypothetical protein
VSFLMCPFCVRVLMSDSATVLSPSRDAARAWDRLLARWHASGGMCNLRVT